MSQLDFAIEQYRFALQVAKYAPELDRNSVSSVFMRFKLDRLSLMLILHHPQCHEHSQLC
jgi:hypothetical protein